MDNGESSISIVRRFTIIFDLLWITKKWPAVATAFDLCFPLLPYSSYIPSNLISLTAFELLLFLFL
jgi:hypothetical protein